MAQLKILRERAGLSQSQLSELSGVNLRTIQAYEAGARNIDGVALRTAIKLAQALNCKPEDLIK